MDRFPRNRHLTRCRFPGNLSISLFESLPQNREIGWDLHCVSENVPPLTCYNLYIHGSIATIFGKNVPEKVGSKMYFIFPPHITIASGLPGETGNPEIVSFHLNAACFYQKTRNS